MTKMGLHVYLIDHTLDGKKPTFCLQIQSENEMIVLSDMISPFINYKGELAIEFVDKYDVDLPTMCHNRVIEYLLSIPEYVKVFKQRVTEYNQALKTEQENTQLKELESLARKLGKKVIDDNEGCV